MLAPATWQALILRFFSPAPLHPYVLPYATDRPVKTQTRLAPGRG